MNENFNLTWLVFNALQRYSIPVGSIPFSARSNEINVY
jgi:hypothetical protein